MASAALPCEKKASLVFSWTIFRPSPAWARKAAGSKVSFSSSKPQNCLLPRALVLRGFDHVERAGPQAPRTKRVHRYPQIIGTITAKHESGFPVAIACFLYGSVASVCCTSPPAIRRRARPYPSGVSFLAAAATVEADPLQFVRRQHSESPNRSGLSARILRSSTDACRTPHPEKISSRILPLRPQCHLIPRPHQYLHRGPPDQLRVRTRQPAPGMDLQRVPDRLRRLSGSRRMARLPLWPTAGDCAGRSVVGRRDRRSPR